MAFKKYERSFKAENSETRASMTSHAILLSEACVKHFKLQKVVKCDLYYDHETGRIGIKFCLNGGLACAPKPASIAISVMGFRTKNRLYYDKISTYDLHMEDDMLILTNVGSQ